MPLKLNIYPLNSPESVNIQAKAKPADVDQYSSPKRASPELDELPVDNEAFPSPSLSRSPSPANIHPEDSPLFNRTPDSPDIIVNKTGDIQIDDLNLDPVIKPFEVPVEDVTLAGLQPATAIADGSLMDTSSPNIMAGIKKRSVMRGRK